MFYMKSYKLFNDLISMFNIVYSMNDGSLISSQNGTGQYLVGLIDINT